MLLATRLVYEDEIYEMNKCSVVTGELASVSLHTDSVCA